jgi:hypothetical protein
MDEREHVRDHLEVGGVSELTDMEDAPTDGLEEWHVSVGYGLVTANDDRDVADRGAVNAAGDGRFERRDPDLGRCGGEPQELVPIVRAHVDPGPAMRQRGKDTVVTFENCGHGARGR